MARAPGGAGVAGKARDRGGWKLGACRRVQCRDGSPARAPAENRTLDQRTRRELERLLGDLDHQRDEERQRVLQRRIREATVAIRFDAAKHEVLRPALREVMASLERRGHLTRLVEPTPQVLRLELLMQARRPVPGVLEVELVEGSGVRFLAHRQQVPAGDLTLPLEQVESGAVARVLVELLQALTAPAPRAAAGDPR